MNQAIGSTDQRPMAVLGWAAFLACSWTWCIGMFLPALLLRDYGTSAWVVFALPNVLGAAAMGWVLQRAGQSEAMVREHAPAMLAFSVVTICFHGVLLVWVIRWLGTVGPLAGSTMAGWDGGTLMMGAVAGATLVFVPLTSYRKSALVASALLWCGSLAAFIVTVVHTDKLPIPHGQASIDLLYLAPTCLIGFALCPYADLTFHRARQALSTFGAIAAFTLGFGALFLVMIVFTLWYGPMALPPDARLGTGGETLTVVAAAAVAWHMVGQTGFTAAAHTVEIARQLRADRQPAKRWGVFAGVAFAAAVLGPMLVLAPKGFSHAGFGTYELAYRLFLAFYALVTPAYMLLRVCPWPRSRSSSSQRWVAFCITLALAGPAFWMGFIERQMVWLTAGIAVLLLARPVVEALSGPGDSRATLTPASN